MSLARSTISSIHRACNSGGLATRRCLAATSTFQVRPLLTLTPCESSKRQKILKAKHRTYASPAAGFAGDDAQVSLAMDTLNKGVKEVSEGNLEEAAKLYALSLSIKETFHGQFYTGCLHYLKQDHPAALLSFEKALTMAPPLKAADPNAVPSEDPVFQDPDQLLLASLHSNLGVVYAFAKPPNTQLALEHLQKAFFITPDDGEICYNLGTLLELEGKEEDALSAYSKADKLGVERAKASIRNCGAKVLRKRLQQEAEDQSKEKKGGGSLTSA